MIPLAGLKLLRICIDAGCEKNHGHSIRSLTQAIFTLHLVGKNLSRGIVLNNRLPFGKDATYVVAIFVAIVTTALQCVFLIKEKIGDRLNSIPKVVLYLYTGATQRALRCPAGHNP
jgi:hypothetical protein